MKTMTIAEFQAVLREQGVSRRADVAFVCPICKTPQSMQSLINAGVGKTEDEVERYIGFSCIGRFTGAGPHKTAMRPARVATGPLADCSSFTSLRSSTRTAGIIRDLCRHPPPKRGCLQPRTRLPLFRSLHGKRTGKLAANAMSRQARPAIFAGQSIRQATSAALMATRTPVSYVVSI